MPFAFHVALPSDAETLPGAPTRIVISKSIEEDVLAHPSGAFNTEGVLVVRCAPQSVFRVRPATRCSSTLSGTYPRRDPGSQLIAMAHRTCIPNLMRIILADGQPPRHGCRRRTLPPLGPRHRDPLARPRGPHRLGALRRVGGHGAHPRHGRPRRPRASPHPRRAHRTDPPARRSGCGTPRPASRSATRSRATRNGSRPSRGSPSTCTPPPPFLPVSAR